MKKGQKPLKRLPMPVAADLSSESLKMAIAVVMGEPHDGWADLVVHSSQVRPAMKLAREHDAGKIKVRVLTEDRHGRDTWFLRTRTAEVCCL